MPVMEIPVVCNCIDSTTRSPTVAGLIMMELSPSVSLLIGKFGVARVIGGGPPDPPDTGPDVGLTPLTVGPPAAAAGKAREMPPTVNIATSTSKATLRRLILAPALSP